MTNDSLVKFSRKIIAIRTKIAEEWNKETPDYKFIEKSELEARDVEALMGLKHLN